jgi:hypothetical protein
MAQHTPPARESGGKPEHERGPWSDKPATRVDSDAGAGAPLLQQPREASEPGGKAPFAWQHGSRLLFLEAGAHGWILAELRFNPDACHYVEVRRTRYRWAREATGACLSRAFVAGEAAVDRMARDLHAWLIA